MQEKEAAQKADPSLKEVVEECTYKRLIVCDNCKSPCATLVPGAGGGAPQHPVSL